MKLVFALLALLSAVCIVIANTDVSADANGKVDASSDGNAAAAVAGMLDTAPHAYADCMRRCTTNWYIGQVCCSVYNKKGNNYKLKTLDSLCSCDCAHGEVLKTSPC